MATHRAARSGSFKVETINEVERKNSRAGFYFFEADTLRFFSSRIHPVVIRNRFFITTEKQDAEHERRATIRMILDDGSTADVGEFQQFKTPGAAEKALKKALEQGISVRNDPYDGEKEPQNPRRFNWRAYIGDLPIGSRNTKWHAQREGGQAKRPAYI